MEEEVLTVFCGFLFWFLIFSGLDMQQMVFFVRLAAKNRALPCHRLDEDI